MKNSIHKTKKGAVSIFVVVFFSLLITVVIVGFIRNSIKDQQSSLTRNLSQSAYDASQVGIEDAKRLLVRYSGQCPTESSTDTNCIKLKSALQSNICNSAVSLLTGSEIISNEVLIQKDALSNYNQAYTCVTISRTTDDFLGFLNGDDTKIVPLIGTSDYDSIQFQWFTKDNIATGASRAIINTITNLPKSSDYSISSPPIVALKLIQAPGNFSTGSLSNSSNTYSRLFIKPDPSFSDATLTSFNIDAPLSPKIIYRSKCDSNFSSGYACSVRLSIPSLADKQISLLEVKPIYNNMDYRVTLWKGDTLVQFNNVQTKIDSTGRASDIYRRIETRVESSVSQSYPTSAVEISGNLCKDFGVTDVASTIYRSCTP